MTQMLPEPANVDAPPPSDERKTVGVSQGRLILRRFLSNKIAVVSGILFILVLGFSVSAIGCAPLPVW